MEENRIDEGTTQENRSERPFKVELSAKPLGSKHQEDLTEYAPSPTCVTIGSKLPADDTCKLTSSVGASGYP